MTTAGKVFSVLSFLLGFVFLFFVTPVAKKLIEGQKQIVSAEEKLPALRESAALLESERLKLYYELNRIKGKVGTEQTKNKNQEDAVRSQLSLLTDLEKAERLAVVTWQKTLGDLKAEMEARGQEKADLETGISENGTERDAQATRVGQLQELLEAARTKLRETLDSMASDYEKLERNTPEDGSDKRVAFER
jgi:chromosome segregation ATPase